jgi:peroxiredoxin Q/BCP
MTITLDDTDLHFDDDRAVLLADGQTNSYESPSADRHARRPEGRRRRTPANIRAMLSPGDSAPDFTLPDQGGNPVSLSGLRGKTVVLYFYPKADTPGCTTQACGIRDHRADYERAGAVVLGVSPDPVDAVAKFDKKYDLDFPLLADSDHAVTEAYGVWVEKSMYGRKYMGAQRATFIIDGDGVVRHVIPKASPKTHDDEVLAALDQLGAAA